ncbi:MAG: ABC transporter permease [Cytophagales bacterium]|nr:ABC transporter permease [Cytophagales bacterium]
MAKEKDRWTSVVTSEISHFKMWWSEMWKDRYLIYLLFRKDFVSKYKQTALGPFWVVLQPIMATFAFFFFGKMVNVSVGTVPPFLFYMLGTIVWSLTSTIFQKITQFLIESSALLTKVYVPKLSLLWSRVCVDILNFFVKLVLFLAILGYFIFFKNANASPNLWALFFPVVLFFQMLFAVGTGLLLSALTLRYRDIVNVINFLVQSLLFVTPVLYPLSVVEDPKYQKLLLFNPLTEYAEFYRYAFLGEGFLDPFWLAYAFTIAVLAYVGGVILLNRIEKVYADVV